MISKVKTILLLVILSIGVAAVFSPAVLAEGGDEGSSCGGVRTAILNCSQEGDDENIENSGVWGILQITLNIMAAGVGIAAIGGFIYAGLLYAAAGDSQEQVKKAIGIITNVVIGLALFAVMYTAVNYLVPGGILG